MTAVAAVSLSTRPALTAEQGVDQPPVSLGNDGDTAQFAVETLRRWWSTVGRDAYPEATKLLITADAGGSNGYRLRLWKRELAALAKTTGPGSR